MQRSLFAPPQKPDSPAWPARPPTQKVAEMRGVVELLDKARAAGLKYPKLWLQFADKTDLRVTVAGEASRTPGFLMLTDGRRYPENFYFGRISPAGQLEIGRDGFARKAELLTLLESLAANPAGVAAQYGHVTGNCCFCGLQLKDDRSITVGYGPVCAKRFGIAWGKS